MGAPWVHPVCYLGNQGTFYSAFCFFTCCSFTLLFLQIYLTVLMISRLKSRLPLHFTICPNSNSGSVWRLVRCAEVWCGAVCVVWCGVVHTAARGIVAHDYLAGLADESAAMNRRLLIAMQKGAPLSLTGRP